MGCIVRAANPAFVELRRRFPRSRLRSIQCGQIGRPSLGAEPC
nr:MAG TPA_asm: Transcription factor E2-alpha [Caudoviricetes sp.]